MSTIENEFKALREEIVRLEKEVLTITYYVFTITLLIAGLNVKSTQSSFLTPMLFQIVLIWGLGRYITATRLRSRISTYIKVFIEPVTKLKWEERNIKFKSIKGVILNQWLSKLTSLFLLLTILGLYISFSLFHKNLNYSTINILAIGVTLLLQATNIYLMIQAVFNYPSSKEYIEHWEKISNSEKYSSILNSL